MKKLFVILASVLVLGSTAKAEDTFFPGWFWGLKAGASWSSAEQPTSQWTETVSYPSLAANVGYQFFPCFGVRGELSGYKSMGVYTMKDFPSYTFNYTSLNIDAVLDICNCFKYKAARVVNPYIFVGLGGNVRFNAKNIDATLLPTKNYYWDKATPSLTGRFGAGIDFRVAPAVAITLEVAENLYTDHFNAKIGNATYPVDLDQNVIGLIGVKFSFDAVNKAKAAEAAAAAAAAEAAAKAAAEKAAAEAAAKAAAEKAAAEKAAREAAEKARKDALANAITAENRNIYFLINKSVIRKTEAPKIDIVANALKTLDCNVLIKGYADKATGNEKINSELGVKRCEAVKKALIEKGIAADRISTEPYGDREQVSDVPALNRVSICVLTD